MYVSLDTFISALCNTSLLFNTQVQIENTSTNDAFINMKSRETLQIKDVVIIRSAKLDKYFWGSIVAAFDDEGDPVVQIEFNGTVRKILRRDSADLITKDEIIAMKIFFFETRFSLAEE